MTTSTANENDKIAKLEKCLDELKNLYEYENQEAFVLNFNLFNDNVKLNDMLKQKEVENEALLAKCDSLTHENKEIMVKCQTLTLENQVLTKELTKIRNDLNEHKRSQSVPKRLNKTLNSTTSSSKKKNSHK